MCEPATLATISLVAGAATTGLGVIQARNQAIGAQNTAEYNAAIADQNRQLAEQDAANQRTTGDRNIDAANLQISQFAAKQRSALAANGADLSSGSALTLQTDTAAAGAADRIARENELERQVYQTRLGASSSAAQASLFQTQADNVNPALTTFGTLLGGATQFASSAYQFNSAYKKPILPTSTSGSAAP